jgi:uncharacterized protein YecE (DUF72 family)
MAGSLSRRERQRLENPARAALMHEARIASGESPVLSGGNEKPAFADKPGIFIGCSGWYYRDWEGCFYPPSLAGKDWFPYYADRFRTVELNAPFYSWPKVATVKAWARQARGRPFNYTVKVNELITHSKRFRRTKALVRDFGYIADLLGPQMGCFLFQMPPG